jgi:1,4-dihydroxy-2-naphthoate octaprenyltransferase
MMHVADINEDREADKHTLVSMVGYGKTKQMYLVATALHVMLAWRLVFVNQKAVYLMLPMLTYALPIAFKVQTAMNHLIKDDEAGKEKFAAIPTLVTIQTMLTPAFFIVITLAVRDCLG